MNKLKQWWNEGAIYYRHGNDVWRGETNGEKLTFWVVMAICAVVFTAGIKVVLWYVKL